MYSDFRKSSDSEPAEDVMIIVEHPEPDPLALQKESKVKNSEKVSQESRKSLVN